MLFVWRQRWDDFEKFVKYNHHQSLRNNWKKTDGSIVWDCLKVTALEDWYSLTDFPSTRVRVFICPRVKKESQRFVQRRGKINKQIFASPVKSLRFSLVESQKRQSYFLCWEVKFCYRGVWHWEVLRSGSVEEKTIGSTFWKGRLVIVLKSPPDTPLLRQGWPWTNFLETSVCQWFFHSKIIKFQKLSGPRQAWLRVAFELLHFFLAVWFSKCCQ